VVIVDMQITTRRHLHVDQRMPRQLVEHVIEEAHARRHLIGTGPVQVEADGDFRLGGRSRDLCLAHLAPPCGSPAL